MYYLYSQDNLNLEMIECGQLNSHESFIHIKRNMDLFVFIMLCKGTLFISQNNNFYELHPNQFIILFPGFTHYGHLPSMPGLSYYWCHFQMKNYTLLQPKEASKIIQTCATDPSSFHGYLLPEFGSLQSPEKTSLLFRLMLDTTLENFLSDLQGHYALRLMVIEIMQAYILPPTSQTGKSLATITEISEWIQSNCVTQLSVHDIAQHFSYNVHYLSALFKKTTGYSLNRYICIARLAIAKRLLLNSDDTIKTIAHNAGFLDEKQFMKMFKQEENMTPTQYRNLYNKRYFSAQLKDKIE